MLQFSVGIFGGHTDDDYDVRSFIDRTATGFGIANPIDTNAQLKSWRVGGDIGGTITVVADTFLAFRFGARVGGAFVHSNMNATGCVSPFGTVYAAGTPCASTLNPRFAALSESRSAGSLRSSGHAGVTINGPLGQLSLLGFVAHDTATPVFQPQNLSSGAILQTGTPASLRFLGSLSYGGSISLRIPFGQ